MVPLTVFAQNRSVEEDCRGWLRSPSAETPSLRWKHPGPAQQISRADRFDEHRIIGSVARFENYFSAFDQIKSVGHFAFLENRLSRFEVNRHRAVCEQCELRTLHSGKKWMKSHSCFHWVAGWIDFNFRFHFHFASH